MIIQRIRVQEGFLDGLDIEFTPGLNSLIGARGTGKTSVIELLRFCLGAGAYTGEVEQVALAHATSVLGTGLVSVTVEIDGQAFTVQRSVDDKAPRVVGSMPPFDPPILLSQNELEKLALNETGKLRLVDDFRRSRVDQQESIKAIQQMIASLTVEISDVSTELSELAERSASFKSVATDLREAITAQQAAIASLKQLEPTGEQLKALDDKKSQYSVQITTVTDAAEALAKWGRSLTRVVQASPTLSAWPPNGGDEDLLAQAREQLREAVQHVEDANKAVKRSIDLLQASIASSQQSATEVEDAIRPLRKTLDKASKGAGELTRTVSTLTERSAQSKALDQRVLEVNRRLEGILEERRKRLEELEAARISVLDDRNAIVTELNDSLAPLVRLAITHAGLQDVYKSELIERLQGSGLRYNTLAPKIAARVSPRELVEAVERNDAEGLADKAEIDEERASRVILQLGSQSLSELLTVWVEDRVNVSLLDGGESKDTSELSTGQRCTAILPVLLRHQERILIMDQPEDHLDNAFIVETLVKAIRERPSTSQLIVTTHNANIPVIGEASNVVLLASTGRRGFVDRSGPLDEPPIVEAISQVMEGGKAAFNRRAQFYDSHLPK